jgi:hypothetical protein
MKVVLPLTFILIAFYASACGKKKSGGGEGEQPQITFEPEGIFSAKLFTVNQKIGTNLNGNVTISKYGDNLSVRIKLKNGPKGMHMQGLYTGDACPYEDLNGDGYIDIKESEKNIKRMLIPFDGDISGRAIGNEYYPSNNYAYERSTSYGLMISDLKKKDQNLQLQGRIIVIHGVDESHTLPGTVSTNREHSCQKSIPIACGILSYVTVEPEEVPDTGPVIIRPTPRPDRPYDPEPIPEVHPPRTYWERMRDRLERWWRRLGGGWSRGHDDQDDDDKP